MQIRGTEKSDVSGVIINHKFTYVNMSSLVLSSSALDDKQKTFFFLKQWEHFKTVQ